MRQTPALQSPSLSKELVIIGEHTHNTTQLILLITFSLLLLSVENAHCAVLCIETENQTTVFCAQWSTMIPTTTADKILHFLRMYDSVNYFDCMQKKQKIISNNEFVNWDFLF